MHTYGSWEFFFLCSPDCPKQPRSSFPFIQQSLVRSLVHVHRWEMTISFHLGVRQFPVENSSGSNEIKNEAQKKLLTFGTFRLIFYLHRNWSLSVINLPFKTLSGQSRFLADATIEDFNFENEKSRVDRIYSFQLFVDFSIWCLKDS